MTPDNPQWGLVVDNATITLKDMVTNTAAADTIRGRVHAMAQEPISGNFFAVFAEIRSRGRNGDVFQTDYSEWGMLRPDLSPVRPIDLLIAENQGKPEDQMTTLICDEAVLRRLQEDGQSITWLSENRFTLLGRPGGSIDIHLYKRGSFRVKKDSLTVTLF